MQDVRQSSHNPRPKKLSRQQLKKMIKNMQKVPKIQQKSEEYHEQQSKHADIKIEKQLEEI